MHQSGSTSPSADEFQAERAYLENLLAARLNFYLVFVSFYFVAVFGADEKVATPGQRAIALALGGVVSLIMALSVQRTTALVERVLDDFREVYPTHPYAQAHKTLQGKRVRSISANLHVTAVPWVVTFAFLLLAVLAARPPAP